MIDIHCHILPGIDDGPSDIATSLEMAKIAAADGITTIVATPHLKSRMYDAAEISDRVEALNGLLQKEGVPLAILPGADVYAMLDPSFLKAFTINNTSYILVEFPHAYLPHNAGEILFEFLVQGFRPIITHPERNGAVVETPRLLLDLLDDNIFVQITGASLTGDFGPDCRECARYLLQKGAVHFIATDAHSTAYRPPVLSQGVRAAARIVGEEKALALVGRNPAAVLAGEALDA